MKTLVERYLDAGGKLAETVDRGDRAKEHRRIAVRKNLIPNELRLARRLFDNGLSDDEIANFKKLDLSWAIVRLLARIPSAEKRENLVKLVNKNEWGWRELADQIRQMRKKRGSSGGRKGGKRTPDRQAVDALGKARLLVASLGFLVDVDKLKVARLKQLSDALSEVQAAARKAKNRFKAKGK